MELYDANSTYNGIGYSQIYKQKKYYFEGATIPNYTELKSRRGLSQSTLSTENRALSTEMRSKTPPREGVFQSRQGTPNQRSRREIRNPIPYPAISSHFLEVYQNEINLDDHLEMRRRYHHSSNPKGRNLQKSHSYNQLKSFHQSEGPFPENQSQLDFGDYRYQSDYDNSHEQYPVKDSAALSRNASKGRLNNEPKQIYFVINPGMGGGEKYSKHNIFDLPANKNNKAHQYNFSFTEREFSEMNK